MLQCTNTERVNNNECLTEEARIILGRENRKEGNDGRRHSGLR